jgi:hypothetical protein
MFGPKGVEAVVEWRKLLKSELVIRVRGVELVLCMGYINLYPEEACGRDHFEHTGVDNNKNNKIRRNLHSDKFRLFIKC